MDVFVDTSAMYALLVEDDESHEAARIGAASLRELGASLVTSSFLKPSPFCTGANRR